MVHDHELDFEPTPLTRWQYILPSDTPSPSIPTPPTPVELLARQATTTVVTGGTNVITGCGGQYSGGVLAGAIVGTFFGTLLLVFLWSAIGPLRGAQEVVVERKVRRHRSRSGGSYGSSVRRPSRVYSTRS